MVMIYSELKRRQKAILKAEQKAEKEAKKAAEVDVQVKNKRKTPSAAADDISPNEYFKLRSAAVSELKKSPETHPYPHKFHVSISLEDYLAKFNYLNEGEMLENEQIRFVNLHNI